MDSSLWIRGQNTQKEVDHCSWESESTQHWSAGYLLKTRLGIMCPAVRGLGTFWGQKGLKTVEMRRKQVTFLLSFHYLGKGNPIASGAFCKRYSTQYICFIENGRRPYNIKALTILEHFLRCVLQTQYNINESLWFPILLELDIPGASYPDGDGSISGQFLYWISHNSQKGI